MRNADTTDLLLAKEKLSMNSLYKENLISTLKCIGISCLDDDTGCILLLPFENTRLRDVVWKIYIRSKKGEERYRSFLVEYFQTHL